jgi:hypothetical protein
MQNELRNVASITGSLSAFAALRFDGSVVCWGDAECGGDAGAKRQWLDMELLVCWVPQIIHFSMIFPVNVHPAIGVPPILGNPHMFD